MVDCHYPQRKTVDAFKVSMIKGCQMNIHVILIIQRIMVLNIFSADIHQQTKLNAMYSTCQRMMSTA